MKPTCRYFARCDRPADGTIDHPLLGAVLCCTRCARVVGLDLQPIEEETAVRIDVQRAASSDEGNPG